MNTVGASYRVFMAFLIVFLLSSATNVNANSAIQTRINILNESEPQRDFYSGSWLASNGSNKVEAFFWKQNHVVHALFYSHDNGYSYFAKINDVKLRGFQSIWFSQYKIKYKPEVEWVKLNYPDLGSEGYYTNMDAQIVDVNNFKLKFGEKPAELKFVERELGSNSDGYLIFSRSKISDEFAAQLNGFQKNYTSSSNGLPNSLAILRSENPRHLVGEPEKKIAEQNIYMRNNSPYDTIKTRPISEISLSQVKDNSRECKAFSRENGKVLFTRLASRKDKERFYFAVEGEGVFFYYQGGGSSKVEMYDSLASQDPKTAMFLCDNPASINSNNSPSVCPLCFYPAGRYLDQVYRGNIRADSSQYMSPHQRKPDAHATVLRAIAGAKRLNLIEEMLGFYMLNYANSPKQCFHLGAFEATKTANVSGYKITDGLGYEVTRVDPYQVSDTYKLNKEFKEACSDICFKHGTLIIEAQKAALFERKDSVKKEKQAVLEVFSSIEKFMIDYDCNSDVRKKFEHNLIKLYNFYNKQ